MDWKNAKKRLPRKSSKNKEERSLGNKLYYIRQYVLKPYLCLETEEERHQYEIVHPEIKEIMEMQYVQDFLLGNRKKEKPSYLKNAREIREWIENSSEKRSPRANSDDEEEKRLDRALNAIKQGLIRPYLALRNDDEKAEYVKKHPELQEVMEIVYEIDKHGKGRIKRELSKMIESELQKLVGKHVDANQETREELIKKAKDFKESKKDLGGKND